MNSLRTKRGWKKFDFEEITVSLGNDKNKSTSPAPSYTPKRKVKNLNFEQQIVPKTIEDLAVHSKKVADVECWLQNEVLLNKKVKKSSILLITGPSGCGKTTTVKVLCKSLDIHVIEWINPVDKDRDYTIGQTSQIIEFLSGTKYPSLLFVNKPYIVLIEDFPNSVIRDPTEFTSVLEKCLDIKSCVIFICTDASHLNLNLAQKLFPDDVRLRFSIHNINFNTTSSTLLKKALKRVQKLIEEYSDTYTIPNQQIIDDIVSSAMGDIRCAVNQYYFTSLKGSNNAMPEAIAPKCNKRKRMNKNVSRSPNLFKNERLDFFHCLGRVLNPKRQEKNGSWRFHCDVGALVEEISMQPSTFNAFIHANYIKYFGNINDVSNAADILCFSQSFLNRWESREEIGKYGLWIPIMGLMVYNEHRISKWNQINAPKKHTKKLNHDMELKSLNVVDRCYYNIIKNNKLL